MADKAVVFSYKSEKSSVIKNSVTVPYSWLSDSSKIMLISQVLNPNPFVVFNSSDLELLELLEVSVRKGTPTQKQLNSAASVIELELLKRDSTINS